jgi:hypothetical protein
MRLSESFWEALTSLKRFELLMPQVAWVRKAISLCPWLPFIYVCTAHFQEISAQQIYFSKGKEYNEGCICVLYAVDKKRVPSLP